MATFFFVKIRFRLFKDEKKKRVPPLSRGLPEVIIISEEEIETGKIIYLSVKI